MLSIKFLTRSLLISSCLVSLSPANAMDPDYDRAGISRPVQKFPTKQEIETVETTYQALKKVADKYCQTYIETRKNNNLLRLTCYEFMGYRNLLSTSQNLKELDKGMVLTNEEREFMEYAASPDVPESSLSPLQLDRAEKLQSRMIDFFLGEEHNSQDQRNLSSIIASCMCDESINREYEPNKIYPKVFDLLGLTANGASLFILDYDFLKDGPDKDSSHGYKTSSVTGILAKNLNVIPIRWKEFSDLENKIKILTQANKEFEEKREEYNQRLRENPENFILLNSEIQEHMASHLKKSAELLDSFKDNLELRKNNELDFLGSLREAVENPKNAGAHIISISITPTLLIKNTSDSLIKFSQMLLERDLLLVFSAGNNALPLSDEFQKFFKTYPEIKERMLIVGSTDRVGDISYFSNKPGNFSDMFIYAQGEHTLREISATDSIRGTSYAAPYVASLLVLLKQYFPALEMKTLKNIVLDTADPFPEYIGGCDCVLVPGKERINRFDNIKEIAGKGTLNPFKAFLRSYSQNR